jgi:hypothetical protein
LLLLDAGAQHLELALQAGGARLVDLALAAHGVARARVLAFQQLGREGDGLARLAHLGDQRASWAMSAQRWARCASAVESDWMSSRRTSNCPAFTLAPSRTRISRTMPPSRCCTVRRLPSTLMVPGAIAPPPAAP